MSRSRALAAAAGILLLGACGLAGESRSAGVSVDQLQTDVVFGAGGTPAPRAVAAVPPLPSLPQPEPSFFQVPTFSEKDTGLCPSAPATGAPAVGAGQTVESLPQEGTYTWAGSGRYAYTVLGITAQLSVPTRFDVVVRHVRRVQDQSLFGMVSAPPLEFTYETVQPIFAFGGGYYDFFWQVKANSQPDLGDPEGGIVLKKVVKLASDGKPGPTLFDSGTGPGLLLVDLPVQPGAVGVQTPNGSVGPTTSTDTSTSGNSMSWNANVLGRERVDACGTWLQGWAVEGQLTNGPSTAQVHFDVATQFGGLMIAENLDGTLLGETVQKGALRQGQTTPGPISQEFR